MEDLRKALKKELFNLEIDEGEEITIKVVEKKFKKKALKVHPDKTGSDDDMEFKELLADFRKVQTALNEIETEDVEHKGDIFTFFEKNNVANEKSQSWTILIERDKVEEWSNVLRRKFGESKLVGSGSGHQFKAPVGEHIVSITLYKYPGDMTPKMNVQGQKIGLRHFVCNVLPEVYKKVSEKDKTKAITSISENQTHNCNICDKVYKQKRRLTTHMELKHTGAITEIRLKTIRNKQEMVSKANTPVQYSCNICGESFLLKANIVRHQKNVHTNTNVKAFEETIEVVDIVDEILGEIVQPSTKEVLQDVVPNAIWLSATNEDLDEMLNAVNDELNNDDVKCEVCNITFQQIEQAEDHIGKIHIKVICDACSEELNTITNLENHKKANHSDTAQEPVQEIPTCDMCGIMLYSDQQIEEHIATHGEIFRKRKSNGYVTQKEKGNSIKLIEENRNNSDEGPYICAECGNPYTSIEATEEHMKRAHADPTKSHSTNVVFLKPTITNCEECKLKDEVISHKESELDKLEKELEITKKEHEKLHVLHDRLKDRHTIALKSAADKKQLFEDNAKLREQTKTSEEMLQDILKLNQILEERNKIMKITIDEDDSMKANAEFLERTGDMSEEVRQQNRPVIKCSQCSYTTKSNTYMKGHMTAHKEIHIDCGASVGNAGGKCLKRFKTEQELQEHIKGSHDRETNIDSSYKCNKCDKTFQTHVALKQHAQSKHEASARLPVGHQAWAREPGRGGKVVKFSCTECQADFQNKTDLSVHVKSHNSNISCNKCGQIFQTVGDQSHHKRTAHRDRNQDGFTKVQSPCRYFLQGWCAKGDMCHFSHFLNRNQDAQWGQGEQVPRCTRGPGCRFWAQGTCFFFHPRIASPGRGSAVGGQDRGGQGQLPIMPCKFQEKCWNQETCRFSHEDFGLQQEFLENY